MSEIKKLANETELENENDEGEEDSGTEADVIEEEEEEEDDDDEDDEEDEEEEDDDDAEEADAVAEIKKKTTVDFVEEEEEENDDENDLEVLEVSDDEEDYKKLENYSVIENLENEHPEIRAINFEEVVALSRVIRDSTGNIIDPLHTSIPFLTKYEKARIIGARAEQIDRGAVPFVKVDENVMNGRTIAIMEFDEKKIPFIVARPMPNKSVEYWRLQDLEFL